jgi:hypothetical protein
MKSQTKALAGNARPGYHKKTQGLRAVPHVLPNGDIVRALVVPRPHEPKHENNPTKIEAAQAKRNRKNRKRLELAAIQNAPLENLVWVDEIQAFT